MEHGSPRLRRHVAQRDGKRQHYSATWYQPRRRRRTDPTRNLLPLLRIVGIAGSLRAASYNRGLLRAAKDVAPEGMIITICELADIPLYNADVEARGDPQPVAELKAAVREADALLIAVPEYNYGMSGVLKNAIDWLSRPPDRSVLRHKPAALMGASPGMTGTARAQLQLRQAFVFTQTAVMMPPPEILVANAHEKFDASGHLTDEDTRARLRNLLETLATWTQLVTRLPDTQLVGSAVGESGRRPRGGSAEMRARG